MIKVFFLIFEPGEAWEKIAQKGRGFLFITFVHLLPLILLSSAVEAWGLARYGKWQPTYGMYKAFSKQEIIEFETLQVVLLIVMVFVSGLLIYKISQTFQDRLKFLQAFSVAAYAFSPLFLLHFMDASPVVNPVVPWLIGIVLVVWILYQGIPRVMKPDPTHAFGVYLSAMIVIVGTSALARIVTGMYLLGYIDLQHSWLSAIIRRFVH
jgi:hypothetical protein